MYIRPLTNEEAAKIKKAKQAANEVLKEQRKDLTKEINNLRKVPGSYGKKATLDDLEQQLKKLQAITGNPVIFSMNGNTMCIDYELLKKLNKSLDPRRFSRKIGIEKKQLTIEYWRNQHHKGTITLYELPLYQLLNGLPTVKIEVVC
jgi:hypothetical protein